METKGLLNDEAPPSYDVSQATNNQQPPYAPGYSQHAYQGGYGTIGGGYQHNASAPAYSPQQPYQQPIMTSNQSTTVVMQQPSTVPVTQYVSVPPNHAFLSWFSCLFCMWPVGLVAVIKSCEVNKAIANGDLPRAHIASESARRFAKISIMLGIIIISMLAIVGFTA